MDRYIIAGIDTDVGKTITAGILTTLLEGIYWKPIDCGANDTQTIKQLDLPTLDPLYAFKTPCSPHYAAALEDRSIQLFDPPSHDVPLIIELAGGVLTPLTLTLSNIDLCSTWNAHWIVVSRHVLGSINHTLLTVEALQRRGISPAGIIFNGALDPCSEPPILTQTRLPCLGHLLLEPEINRTTLKKYAQQWKTAFGALVHK